MTRKTTTDMREQAEPRGEFGLLLDRLGISFCKDPEQMAAALWECATDELWQRDRGLYMQCLKFAKQYQSRVYSAGTRRQSTWREPPVLSTSVPAVNTSETFREIMARDKRRMAIKRERDRTQQRRHELYD